MAARVLPARSDAQEKWPPTAANYVCADKRGFLPGTYIVWITLMQRKTITRRMLLLPLALLCVLSFAPTAHADDALGEVLTVMKDIGALDPAVLDARDMLSCLVANNGNAGACFDIPTEAEKQAGKAAAKFMPDDPKIQALVRLVFAVQKEQWLTVIEIAGLDIVAKFLCENSTRLVGPVGKWFCSDPFQKVVAGYAKPIVKEAFRLIDGGSLDLVKLLELVALLANLDLACDLIPNDIPGVGEACSALGKIIAEIGGLFVDAAKYGADIVVSAADDVENIIFGSDAHMPYDKYYGLYWLPWLHKSVNLCVTDNCKGVGQVNEKIWNSCVDYFDAHNQYRSTAKKTCDDMRDKRYRKAYELLSKAIVDGARAYVLSIREGAKAWAITEYGKNNDAGLRSHFLTLCETGLEQGYPLSSGNPAMCDAYKNAGTGFNKALFDTFYDKCKSEVAAQQVSPTAWRNACKKAEPDFVLMLQGEKQALQNSLTSLVSEGCMTPPGWSAQQGLRFQCQAYSGYDQCLKVMVVGANSICSVDRVKADAARAKEILAFLGTTRCSLNGTEILCHRPWKQAQCQQLVKSTASIQLAKTKLSCKEESQDYYKIAFANKALLDELNKRNARGGQGPACEWVEDKAKIRCLRTGALESRLAASPELQRPLCKPDPHYNGSDESCYLTPYNLKTAPQAALAIPGQVPATAMPATAIPGAARSGAVQAPPNPCDYEATYYEPLPPVIETSAPNYQVGDQVQISCAFEKRTKKLEWQQCDDFAKNAIQVMKYGAESGSRYSGLFVVDGTTIGVSSSPMDGGNFKDAALWTFSEAGEHVVSCMVDNGLRPSEKDGAIYLESQSEVTVSSATGPQTYRRFDPEAARRLPTRE